MISRAVVELADDSTGIQSLKLSALADEERDEVERFQDYGFTGVPIFGAEAVVVCPQGNREHMIAIKVDNRLFRLKGLLPGEVAMYTDELVSLQFNRAK
jgi:phage baseplate assembly protein V